MNTLLAVDDGIAQANYDWADGFFLGALVLAALAGLAYATGYVGTVDDRRQPPVPPLSTSGRRRCSPSPWRRWRSPASCCNGWTPPSSSPPSGRC